MTDDTGAAPAEAPHVEAPPHVEVPPVEVLRAEVLLAEGVDLVRGGRHLLRHRTPSAG